MKVYFSVTSLLLAAAIVSGEQAAVNPDGEVNLERDCTEICDRKVSETLAQALVEKTRVEEELNRARELAHREFQDLKAETDNEIQRLKELIERNGQELAQKAADAENLSALAKAAQRERDEISEKLERANQEVTVAKQAHFESETALKDAINEGIKNKDVIESLQDKMGAHEIAASECKATRFSVNAKLIQNDIKKFFGLSKTE